MSEFALACVEEGMRFAQRRAAVLAADVANAKTPGFVAGDIAPVPQLAQDGPRFAAAMRQVDTGSSGLLEYAMGASARNSVTYRALAEQERAMLREFRVVAEEARR